MLGALALASLAIVLEDAHDHDDLWFGLAAWGVLMVFIAVVAAVLAAIVSLVRRRRPSKRLLLGAVLVALMVLFPVPASWDTVEGPDSAHGLIPSLAYVPLAFQDAHDPILVYSETCCG